MVKTKRDRKEEWEREHVQRVLDYHNKKYGTHIEIEDKTQKVRLDLKGKSDWDWVCCDTRTGDEIALEVKKLTDPKLEEKSNVMWELLEEIQSSLNESKKLLGKFFLSFHIPQDYCLPFDKKGNRQLLRDVICETVYQTAQTLKLGETIDLIPQIAEQLPFVLPNVFVCDLDKFSDEGNVLYKGSGIIGCWSIGFDKPELEKFEQLVSHANMQLKQSNTKGTLLVLIEERERPIDPPEIEEAFKSINTASYSEIRHVYFIRGEEVIEIPLPTP